MRSPRAILAANDHAVKQAQEFVSIPKPSSIAVGGPLTHEWVVFPLVPDGGRRPVAGIDDRIGREGEELGADAAEEQVAVAAGEVEAADAFAKEHVAAE